MAEPLRIPRNALAARVTHHAAWRGWIEAAFDPANQTQAHLAVMREPYLSFVRERRKTVESRFSRVQTPPFGYVAAGDILLLKEVAGPVTALARVVTADFYTLDAAVFARLRDRFAAALCATDPDFWDERRDARYATLMRIDDVTIVDPLPVDKRDRRGWVVLTGRDIPSPGQLGLDLGVPEVSSAVERLVPELPFDQPAEVPAAQLSLALEEASW
jgi:hypothetical protein